MNSNVDNSSKVNPERVILDTDHGILENEATKWGMPLKDVYKYGLTFYKDKEGKAIHLSYEDRLKLVAYTQQAAHGSVELNSLAPLGVLDVIGRDRRAAWQALGKMSQVQAMAGFVHALDRLCPLFKPYLEAILKDLEEKNKQQSIREEEVRSQEHLQKRLLTDKENQQSNHITEEQQIQRIKDALNAQTYDQFLQYAQQQYPGNFDQQAVLIRQLQDQHYHQYIQQLAADRKLSNSLIVETDNARVSNDNEISPPKNDFETDCNLNSRQETAITDTKCLQTSEKNELSDYTQEECSREEDSDAEGDGFPPIEEARMWTRAEITQFKETARAGGGRLTVGHGETVTIRVPTHQRAHCLCWEFATDNYDIGFGLYFEWSKSPTFEVTVHVSESDDEDDGDDDVGYGDEEVGQGSDPELGTQARETSALASMKAPVSIVIPIYRRDCHMEVYAGAHTYPGEGVYLLKFDNTYSLWRSKTLYYKVYYTQ